jgi:hypothetical protein
MSSNNNVLYISSNFEKASSPPMLIDINPTWTYGDRLSPLTLGASADNTVLGTSGGK